MSLTVFSPHNSKPESHTITLACDLTLRDNKFSTAENTFFVGFSLIALDFSIIIL